MTFNDYDGCFHQNYANIDTIMTSQQIAMKSEKPTTNSTDLEQGDDKILFKLKIFLNITLQWRKRGPKSVEWLNIFSKGAPSDGFLYKSF